MNVINQVSYVRSSKSFPEDPHLLALEVDRSYIELANGINVRVIGLFPVNRPAVTGESWFVSQNKRQQTLRQVFAFTSTASITHGIDFGTAFQKDERITRSFGQYTDGTNWYGLIPGTNVAIAGQISFYVTPTQIVFMTGGGAPALVRGNVVIEWLSDP